MKAITFLSVVFLLVFSLNSSAQISPAPQSYSLTTANDYKKHESDIINTINWLEQTSWDKTDAERQRAASFLLAWLSGSPNITIELGDKILTKIMDKNKESLVSYMGGYTMYALKNRDDKNTYDINKAKLAGFRALIAKYNLEVKARARDKNVEMLSKLDKEGKLENWIATEFAKK